MSDSDKVIALLISLAKCRPALVGPAGAGAPRVVGLAASVNARLGGKGIEMRNTHKLNGSAFANNDWELGLTNKFLALADDAILVHDNSG